MKTEAETETEECEYCGMSPSFDGMWHKAWCSSLIRPWLDASLEAERERRKKSLDELVSLQKEMGLYVL